MNATPKHQMIFLIGNPTDGFTHAHGPYDSDFGGSIEDNDHPIRIQNAPAPNASDPSSEERHVLIIPNVKTGFTAIGPITTDAQAAALTQQHPSGELLPLHNPQPDYMPDGPE